jgi:hypothetical protein
LGDPDYLAKNLEVFTMPRRNIVQLAEEEWLETDFYMFKSTTVYRDNLKIQNHDSNWYELQFKNKWDRFFGGKEWKLYIIIEDQSLNRFIFYKPIR